MKRVGECYSELHIHTHTRTHMHTQVHLHGLVDLGELVFGSQHIGECTIFLTGFHMHFGTGYELFPRCLKDHIRDRRAV